MANVLKPFVYRHFRGERGIRTPESVSPITRFPGVHLDSPSICFSRSYEIVILDLQVICKFFGFATTFSSLLSVYIFVKNALG